MPQNGDNGNDSESSIPKGGAFTEGVTAIAMCKSTLEAQKFVDGTSGALAFLQKTLQVYDTYDLEDDAMEIEKTSNAASNDLTNVTNINAVLSRLFDDVPFSAAECHQAWVDLCGFVHEDRSVGKLATWRPSAEVRLDVWKKIMEGSVLQGIDVEQQFLIGDLWASTVDDTAELFPRGLFDAIIRHLMDDSDTKLQVLEDLKCKSLHKNLSYCDLLTDIFI